MSQMIKSQTTIIIILSSSLILSMSSACFITNCPPGGKRSSSMGRFGLETRKCTSCGPSEFHGQCYGSQICCSKTFGCLIGTPETEKCGLENTLTTPCENSGKSCGGFDMTQQINGHCAAEGICCSTDVCTMDPVCNWGDIQQPTPPSRQAAAGSVVDDEDCEDDLVIMNKPNTPAGNFGANPNAAAAAARWKQGQILFPRLNYGYPYPLLHYQLLNTKRYFDYDDHVASASVSAPATSAGDKRSSTSTSTGSAGSTSTSNTKANLLKSTRPGLNSIVRKLFSISKRSPPVLLVHDKANE